MAIEKIAVDISSNILEIKNDFIKFERQIININNKLQELNGREVKLKIDVLLDLNQSNIQTEKIEKQAASILEQVAKGFSISNIVKKALETAVKKAIEGALIRIGGIFKKFEGFQFNFDASPLAKKAGNLALLAGVSSNIILAAHALRSIDENIPSFSGDFTWRIVKMGLALAAISSLALGIKKFSNILIKVRWKDIVKSLAIITGISANLITAAFALEQVDKRVPKLSSGFGDKLKSVAAAIVGMGGFIAIVGAVTKISGKFLAITMGLGAAMIIGISTTIITAAEAIRQINEKVPSNIDSVINKVRNIGDVLQEIASTSVVQGFSALGNFVNLIRVALLAETLRIYASIAEYIEKLQRFNFNEGAIKESINNITTALQLVSNDDIVTEFEALNNRMKAMNTQLLAEKIRMYAEVVEHLRQLERVNFKPEAIKENIEKIESVISELTSGGGIFAKGWNFLFGDTIDTSVVEAAQAVFENFVAIAEAIKIIENVSFDPDKLEEQISELQGTFELLKEVDDIVDANSIDTETVAKASQAIGYFKEIAVAIDAIQQVRFDYTNIRKQLDDLQKVVNHLHDMNDVIRTIHIEAEGVAEAAEAMSNFKTIAQAIDAIQEVNIDPGLIQQQLILLQGVARYLHLANDNIRNIYIDTDGVEQAAAAMGYFKTIAEAINAIQEVEIDEGLIRQQVTRLQGVVRYLELVNESIRNLTIDTDGVEQAAYAMSHFKTIAQAIDTIQEVEIDPTLIEGQVYKLQNVVIHLDYVNAAIRDMYIDTDGVQQASEAMDHFKTIAQAIDAIQEVNIDPTLIEDQVYKLQNVVIHLEYVNEAIRDMYIDTDGVQQASEAMGHFKTIAQAIQTIQEVQIDLDEVRARIQIANEVLDEIRDFVSGAEDVGDMNPIQESIDQFRDLIASLAELNVEFNATGNSFATELLAGFNEVDAPDSILEKITTLVTTLKDKAEGYFKVIGKDYGQKLKDAFSDAVDSLSTAVSEEFSIMEGYAGSFETLGTTFGSNLVTAFQGEISKISGIVERQITNLQTQLNSLRAPSIGTASIAYRASGGLIPAGIGGLESIFTPRGTDTVPAMLTPGEFVQKKSAVGLFGLDFMRRVNNGDVSGVFRAMTSRFNMPFTTSSSVSNAVQNINNTTNNANRITMNTQSVNPDYMMKRISRYF